MLKSRLDEYLSKFRSFNHASKTKAEIHDIALEYAGESGSEINGVYLNILDIICQKVKSLSDKSGIRTKISLITILNVSFESLTEISKHEKVRLLGNILSIFEDNHFKVKYVTENSEQQNLIDNSCLLTKLICAQPMTLISVFVEYELKRSLDWLKDINVEGRVYSGISILTVFCEMAPSKLLQFSDSYFEVIWKVLSHNSQLIRRKGFQCLKNVMVEVAERKPHDLKRYASALFTVAHKQFAENGVIVDTNSSIRKQRSFLWARRQSGDIKSSVVEVNVPQLRLLEGCLSVFIVLLELTSEGMMQTSETVTPFYETIIDCTWIDEIKTHSFHTIKEKLFILLPLLVNICKPEEHKQLLRSFFPYLVLCIQGDLYGFPSLQHDQSLPANSIIFAHQLRPEALIALSKLFRSSSNSKYLEGKCGACLKMIRTLLLQYENPRASEDIFVAKSVEGSQQIEFILEASRSFIDIVENNVSYLSTHKSCLIEIELIIPLLFVRGLNELAAFAAVLVHNSFENLQATCKDTLFQHLELALFKVKGDGNTRVRENSGFLSQNTISTSGKTSFSKSFNWRGLKDVRTIKKVSLSLTVSRKKPGVVGSEEASNDLKVIEWRRNLSLMLLVKYDIFKDPSDCEQVINLLDSFLSNCVFYLRSDTIKVTLFDAVLKYIEAHPTVKGCEDVLVSVYTNLLHLSLQVKSNSIKNQLMIKLEHITVILCLRTNYSLACLTQLVGPVLLEQGITSPLSLLGIFLGQNKERMSLFDVTTVSKRIIALRNLENGIDFLLPLRKTSIFLAHYSKSGFVISEKLLKRGIELAEASRSEEFCLEMLLFVASCLIASFQSLGSLVNIKFKSLLSLFLQALKEPLNEIEYEVVCNGLYSLVTNCPNVLRSSFDTLSTVYSVLLQKLVESKFERKKMFVIFKALCSFGAVSPNILKKATISSYQTHQGELPEARRHVSKGDISSWRQHIFNASNSFLKKRNNESTVLLKTIEQQLQFFASEVHEAVLSIVVDKEECYSLNTSEMLMLLSTTKLFLIQTTNILSVPKRCILVRALLNMSIGILELSNKYSSEEKNKMLLSNFEMVTLLQQNLSIEEVDLTDDFLILLDKFWEDTSLFMVILEYFLKLSTSSLNQVAITLYIQHFIFQNWIEIRKRKETWNEVLLILAVSQNDLVHPLSELVPNMLSTRFSIKELDKFFFTLYCICLLCEAFNPNLLLFNLNEIFDVFFDLMKKIDSGMKSNSILTSLTEKSALHSKLATFFLNSEEVENTSSRLLVTLLMLLEILSRKEYPNAYRDIIVSFLPRIRLYAKGKGYFTRGEMLNGGILIQQVETNLINNSTSISRKLIDFSHLKKLNQEINGIKFSEGVSEKLLVNVGRLLEAFVVTVNPSKEDWVPWFSRVNLELLRESPFSIIRIYATLGQLDSRVLLKFFKLAFLATWIGVGLKEQNNILSALETALSCNTFPQKEVGKPILDMLEYMEIFDQGLPLDLGLTSRLATILGFSEMALYYKEAQFRNYAASSIEDLIQLYNKTGLNHAAEGLVELAEREWRTGIKVKAEWYCQVNQWEKALLIFATNTNFADSTTFRDFCGMILCLQKLGEWEAALQLSFFGLEKFKKVCKMKDLNVLRRKSMMLETLFSSLSPKRVLKLGDTYSLRKGIRRITGIDESDIEDIEQVIRQKIGASLFSLQSWDVDEETSAKIRQCSPVQKQLESRAFTAILPIIRREACIVVDSTSSKVSYKDLHPKLVQFHQLLEMEECLAAKENPSRLNILSKTWYQRLLLMNESVDDILPIMINRGNVFSPLQDEKSWLWFAKLCLKQSRARLSLRCFMNFGFVCESNDLKSLRNIKFAAAYLDNYEFEKMDLISGFVKNNPAAIIPPSRDGVRISCTVLYQFFKLSWKFNEKYEAIGRLRRLIAIVARHLSDDYKQKLNFHILKPASTDDFGTVGVDLTEYKLKELSAKMLCRLARWSLQLDLGSNMLSSGLIDERKISGVAVAGSFKDRLSAERLTTCIDFCESAVLINPLYSKGWHAYALLNYRLASEFLVKDSSKLYVKSLTGFFKALEINNQVSKSVVQDLLRILSIWFSNSNDRTIRTALQKGFSQISPSNWLHVLPQLIGKIACPGDLVSSLLIKVSSAFPHELVYPLAVAGSDEDLQRSAAAKQVLSSLRSSFPKLVNEAILVSEELVRISVLWEERWVSVLEEAARFYFGKEKNIEGMIRVLLPIHQQLVCSPASMNEVVFFQRYARKLQLAAEWLQEYISRATNSKRGMTSGFSCLRSKILRTELSRGKNFHIEETFEYFLSQAWDYYHQCFQMIMKDINFDSLVLSYISPRLTRLENLELRIPKKKGTRLIQVEIQSFADTVQVFSSKQRPRVIRMNGSDGNVYPFLLKGHEDLRLDERLMQLFDLVNSLIQQDAQLSPVKCYSVTPLSKTVGIMEFVPNTETLHDVVRRFREKREIALNIELTLINQRTDSYDDLVLWEKLAIFENIRENTSGLELQKSFWSKSPTAEEWLKARNNFTNTLSSMSIVGYIIGLGDRHPSNIMVDNLSGKIMHIDFGDCFELGMQRKKYPETVPFRLTRMLQNCLDLGRIDGMFKFFSNKVMELLRENSESILTLLEAFVYDPLLNWKVPDNKPKEMGSSNFQGDFESWRARSYIHSSSEASLMDEMERNHIASTILERIKDKLNGTDCILGGGEQWDGKFVTLSTSQQVERLIELATSARELCALYFGWCPFW